MEDKKGSNSLIIIILIIGILVGIYYYFNNKTTKTDEEMSDADYGEYIPNPKKYDINEYSKLSISDEQMSRIYLVDFQHYLKSDITKAYSLVDPTYAKLKCNTQDSFINLVDSMKLKNSTIKKYSVYREEEYTYYTVVDSNNNVIVFKTEGVMQYTVYLDNETVVIEK